MKKLTFLIFFLAGLLADAQEHPLSILDSAYVPHSDLETVLASNGRQITFYMGKSFSGRCRVQITSVYDSLSYTEKVKVKKGMVEMDVSYLKPGVYLFEASHAQALVRKKLFKPTVTSR